MSGRTGARAPRIRPRPIATASAWIDARPQWLVAAMLGIVAIPVLWFRIPTAARALLWAEDGRDFLGDAIHGGWWVLLDPYQGYLHLLPRALAAIVAPAFPIELWPNAVTALSVVVVGGVVSLVWVIARPWVPNPITRGAIALVPVFLPLVPIEVVGNAANLHWFLLWAGFWVVLARPGTWLGTAVLAVIAMVIALTEIQVAAVLPLALLQRRHPRAWPVSAAVIVGVIAQLVLGPGDPRPDGDHPPIAPGSIAIGYTIHVLLPLAGTRTSVIHDLLVSTDGLVVVVAVVVLAAALSVTLVAGDAARRQLASAATIASLGFYTVSIVVNRRPFFDFAELPVDEWMGPGLQRYGVVPGMFAATVLLLAMDSLAHRGGPVRISLVVIAALAMLVVIVVNYRPEYSLHESGPPWTGEIAEAADACERLGPDDTVALATAPGRQPWVIEIPCRLIEVPAR